MDKGPIFCDRLSDFRSTVTICLNIALLDQERDSRIHNQIATLKDSNGELKMDPATQAKTFVDPFMKYDTI